MNKKTFRIVLAFLPWVMAVVAVTILLRNYPFHQLVDAFGNANAFWFLAYAVVYFLVVWFLDCVSLARLFARFGFKIPLKELMRFRFAAFLPMILGFGIGQGFLAYFFKKRGKVPFFIGSGLILFIFFIDLYWTCSLACLGSFLSALTVRGVDLSPFIRALWAGATVVFLSVILFCKYPPAWRAVSWIRTRDIFHAFHRARFSDYVSTAMSRLPIHLAVNTTLFVLAPIFGASLPLTHVMAAQPVITLIGAIPITPGGIGTVQLATAEFFRSFVSNPSMLVSMSLLFMATTTALQAAAGIVFIRGALRLECEPESEGVGAAKNVVFVVNNFLVGGAERVIARLIAGLKGRLDVSVVCVCGASPADPLLRGEGVQLYHADSHSAADTLLYKLRWVLRLPLTFYKTVRLLSSLRPDVVVTSLYQADIVGGLAASLLGIRRRVLIQHDHEPMGWVVRRLKQKFIASSSQIVANSEATGEFLQTYWKVSPQKITVIPNGIPQERFREIARGGGGENAPIRIGAIGRLQPVKGIDHFLAALALLKAEGMCPGVEIMGAGGQEAFLRQFASDQGLSNVRFSGEMQEPVPFFQRVDVVVVPSLREGFGLVVLEALVSGKCVVASDIPAFRTLITHGKNGFLFPPGDALALAQVLKSLMRERTVLSDIRHGVNAWVDSAGRQYDATVMIEKYANVLGGG